VTDEEIASSDIEPSTSLHPVKGTMKIRQLHTASYGVVRHRMLSCYCSKDSYTMCDCFKWTLVDFSVIPMMSYPQTLSTLTGRFLFIL